MVTNPTGVAPNTTWRALVLIRATLEDIGEVSEQVEQPDAPLMWAKNQL